MKRIYKNDEPQEILQWKSKFKNKNGRVPRYSDLNEVENLPHKILLKNSLLSEQGHICCYCCKPIRTDNSHIEHIRPKERDEYRAISLEYENLLASCQGYHDREENCGHSKDNAFNEELLFLHWKKIVNRYLNSVIGERLKPLTEMNGLRIQLRY